MIKLAISFPLKGRQIRNQTGNKPKEFYYGSIGLSEKYNVVMVDSRKEPNGIVLKFLLYFETFINRIISFGFYKSRVYANKKKYKEQNIIISFTDFYSLNLGLYYKNIPGQKIVGAFHGLSDIISKFPIYVKYYVSYKIRKSLKNLDHLIFFGKADMNEAIRIYGLDLNKAHLLKFGIDHLFWTDNYNSEEPIDILCVGSDVNRDYEILKKIRKNIKIKLLTSKKIDLSINPNISYLRGNLHESEITDEDLRKFYHLSKIILIPLHDVFQPSGYSVALQAMSCGKLVIISKIKGIFDEQFLKDRHNICFVKPGSPKLLQVSIDEFINNQKIRKKIGVNARKTVVENFTLKHMSSSLEEILNKI